MSPRRSITTNRALRAGTTLHELLDDAHQQARNHEGTDPMASVVLVVIRALLDGEDPEAVLIAAAETWEAAHERNAAIEQERQALHQEQRRRSQHIVDTYPCPACGSPAGTPCITLSPARRVKPDPHAARGRVLNHTTTPEAST